MVPVWHEYKAVLEALQRETYVSLKDVRACRLYKDEAGTIMHSVADHPRVTEGNAAGSAAGAARKQRQREMRKRAMLKVRSLPVDSEQVPSFDLLMQVCHFSLRQTPTM